MIETLALLTISVSTVALFAEVIHNPDDDPKTWVWVTLAIGGLLYWLALALNFMEN